MIEIKAYAKINLTFKILNRLPNGYHKISSIFQAVSIYDVVSISKEEKSFCLTGSVICPPKENLVTKSKETLESFVGREFPCKINLVKNIPVCAGLGGGSSDAAATLIGLNKLYKLDLSLEHLINVSLEVGSDVPFFISNVGTALVQGVGERIKPVKKRLSRFYVLARPHKRFSTSKMYSLFDEQGKTLFELAQEICPSVKELYSHFAPVAYECGMSGSGPTIFAGFTSYSKALKSVEDFGVEKFDGDFFICKPSRKTYEIIRC